MINKQFIDRDIAFCAQETVLTERYGMIACIRSLSPLWPRLAAALSAAVVAGPAPALAQSIAPPEAGLTSALGGEALETPGEWAFALGAGVGYAPDFEGSEDYEPVPLLLARAQRDEIFVTLEANTLRANLVPAPVCQAGPLIRDRT